MPMGLINAPAIFQKLINHVLYDHLDDFVMIYLNNIFIYLKTQEEHEEHVKEILQ